jgi:hypothetical protein
MFHGLPSKVFEVVGHLHSSCIPSRRHLPFGPVFDRPSTVIVVLFRIAVNSLMAEGRLSVRDLIIVTLPPQRGYATM